MNGEWRMMSGVVVDLAIRKGAGVLGCVAFQIKADRGLRVALVVLQVSAMQGPMAWYVKQDDASRGGARQEGVRVRASGDYVSKGHGHRYNICNFGAIISSPSLVSRPTSRRDN